MGFWNNFYQYYGNTSTTTSIGTRYASKLCRYNTGRVYSEQNMKLGFLSQLYVIVCTDLCFPTNRHIKSFYGVFIKFCN